MMTIILVAVAVVEEEQRQSSVFFFNVGVMFFEEMNLNILLLAVIVRKVPIGFFTCCYK